MSVHLNSKCCLILSCNLVVLCTVLGLCHCSVLHMKVLAYLALILNPCSVQSYKHEI